MDVYIENGYDNRDDYLKCLAEDFGVELEIVEMLANLFGPNEDFDALVTSLEDMSQMLDDMFGPDGNFDISGTSSEDIEDSA